MGVAHASKGAKLLSCLLTSQGQLEVRDVEERNPGSVIYAIVSRHQQFFKQVAGMYTLLGKDIVGGLHPCNVYTYIPTVLRRCVY